MKEVKEGYTGEEKEKGLAVAERLKKVSTDDQQKIFWIIKGMQLAREGK